jgi:hypothetical protein
MAPELQMQAHYAVMRGGPRPLSPATHTEWQLRRFPPSNFVSDGVCGPDETNGSGPKWPAR